MENQLITRTVKDGVSTVTLSQPEKRNPLSLEMINTLSSTLREAYADTDTRVIVLASTGPVFSAGHDLKEMARRKGEDDTTQAQRLTTILSACADLMQTIIQGPKVVIAAVQGMATAAGCQLVAACDLAVASSTARFCTPGVNIGGFCTTPLVTIGRNIPRKHAMELALTGDAIDAETAERLGLVNRVVAPERLEMSACEFALRIAGKSAAGIKVGKADFYAQLDMPLEQAFEYATKQMVKAMMTIDSDEGICAFFEKRAPEWRDI